MSLSPYCNCITLCDLMHILRNPYDFVNGKLECLDIAIYKNNEICLEL
jgi:hypothetical protein